MKVTRAALAYTAVIVIAASQVSPGQENKSGLEGQWSATLNNNGFDVPLLLSLGKSGNRYSGNLNMPDQGRVIPFSSVRVDGSRVHIEFNGKIGVNSWKTKASGYEGTLSASGTIIDGNLTGHPLPLVLTRSAPTQASGQAVDVRIPVAPTVFRGGDRSHIAYELRITNSSSAAMSIKQIDVIGDRPLASFAERALTNIVSADRILPGARVVAFIWVTQEEGAAIPATIHHKLIFDTTSFEGAETSVATQPLPVLGPPLRGEGWLAANGPGNSNGHRRAVLRLPGGAATMAQRFAIDWLQLWPGDKMYKGPATDNKNWRSYWTEVIAVASGVIVNTHDGVPENVPGETSRAVPMTAETMAGNYIVLDVGQGRFACYAHLQPGSLKVKVGDRVERGQVLALLGNSGNSDAPHLHFQVTNGSSFIGSEGEPYAIESFEIRVKGKYEQRKNQIPMSDEIVRF
jgi:hypothetical protein